MALNPNLLNIVMIWCLVLLFLVINVVKHEEFEAQRLLGEGGRIANLPGQKPVSFLHYADYVRLPNSGKRALFYSFGLTEQRHLLSSDNTHGKDFVKQFIVCYRAYMVALTP
ncbi:serine carboxypeptidase-like 35 [Pyrus ussuriensis x Pyrus communis]|uniref:Serine carboxypeptidase-like 35 n=1 Tax=Pyrus ussuriensis x Pyrus communis TaxID=2448454 RepID=A0A5N5FAQ5_9ROSA|nr:serine carboxypeptidase-like 35 [Pyrus ussuriensis x Pyrus communis]